MKSKVKTLQNYCLLVTLYLKLTFFFTFSFLSFFLSLPQHSCAQDSYCTRIPQLCCKLQYIIEGGKGKQEVSLRSRFLTRENCLPLLNPLLHYPPVPFWLAYIRLQIPLRLGGFPSTEIKASFLDSRSLVRFTHSQNTFVGKEGSDCDQPITRPLGSS